jgi:hypothetical protein
VAAGSELGERRPGGQRAERKGQSLDAMRYALCAGGKNKLAAGSGQLAESKGQSAERPGQSVGRYAPCALRQWTR